MTIKELCIESHEIALEKGWWDKPRSRASLVNLFVSEISEALEAARYNRWEGDHCIGEELADAAIRLGDMVIGLEQGMSYGEYSWQIKRYIKELKGYKEEIVANLASMDVNASAIEDALVLPTISMSDFFAKKVGLRHTWGSLLTVAMLFDIDLEKHIVDKMAHNKTRPRMHGGKKF